MECDWCLKDEHVYQQRNLSSRRVWSTKNLFSQLEQEKIGRSVKLNENRISLKRKNPHEKNPTLHQFPPKIDASQITNRNYQRLTTSVKNYVHYGSFQNLSKAYYSPNPEPVSFVSKSDFVQNSLIFFHNQNQRSQNSIPFIPQDNNFNKKKAYQNVKIYYANPPSPKKEQKNSPQLCRELKQQPFPSNSYHANKVKQSPATADKTSFETPLYQPAHKVRGNKQIKIKTVNSFTDGKQVPYQKWQFIQSSNFLSVGVHMDDLMCKKTQSIPDSESVDKFSEVVKENSESQKLTTSEINWPNNEKMPSKQKRSVLWHSSRKQSLYEA